MSQHTASLPRQAMGWAIKAVISKVFFGLILFLSAGRWDWAWGWGYIGIFALFDLACAVLLMPTRPDVLVERASLQAGTKSWDKVIVRFAAGYLPMACWIVAGLHFRWGWQPAIPLWGQLIATVVVTAGYAIVTWAMVSNAFFSATVRIQTERGHAVATGGPYRYVRHPGYVGAILFTLACPIMLGSWWSLIPGVLAAGLYVVRTALEDKTLQDELEGYKAYTEKTAYRLLPGVW